MAAARVDIVAPIRQAAILVAAIVVGVARGGFVLLKKRCFFGGSARR